MLLLLGLLFVVVPIVELAVIVQVAQSIGVAETIALLVVVSVSGAWLVKREGLSVLRRLGEAVDRGSLPHREVIDGFLILFAGALLLTPGFLSDLFGVLLLLPPVRAGVRGVIARSARRRSPWLRVVTVRGSTDTTASRGPRAIDITEPLSR